MVPYGTGTPDNELFVFVCLAVYFCSCDNILTRLNFERNEDPCKSETTAIVKLFVCLNLGTSYVRFSSGHLRQ